MSLTPESMAPHVDTDGVDVGAAQSWSDERARIPWNYVILAVVVGFGWRLGLALVRPVLARDGVTFCWYAEALGEQGLAYLREPGTQQHPLFPALILGVQRLLAVFDSGGGPLLWEWSGQLVALLAGTVVIALSAVLAFDVARRLDVPFPAGRVAVWAAWLAALLPLNTWLSADVMSDQVQLAFYLGAVVLLLRGSAPAVLLASGLCAGAAFLTRPEALSLVIVAGVTLACGRWYGKLPQRASGLGVWLLGFVVRAGPYWVVTGSLSPKKDLGAVLGQEAAVAPLLEGAASTGVIASGETGLLVAQAVVLAKLERLANDPVSVVLDVGEKLARATRVVILVLAGVALWHARRRWWGDPLLPLVVGFVVHLALAGLLRYEWQYLSPRHLLIAVNLLVPLAALTLAGVPGFLATRGPRWLGPVIYVFVLVPLVGYSLRIPNGHEGYLRTAAAMVRTGPEYRRASNPTLVSGSSPRRVAFYADLEWLVWHEDPELPHVLLRTLREERPTFWAIETGDGFETRGNAAVLEIVREHSAVGPYLRRVAKLPVRYRRLSGEPDGYLHVYAIAWPEQAETGGA